MVARPALYNGLRHFVFVVPPFAVLGGLAAGWIVERARRYGTSGAGRARRHLCRRHRVAGRSTWCGCIPTNTLRSTGSPAACAAAQDNYMLDYWGLAFKQAADELRARLAAGARASAQGPPLGGGDLRTASVGARSSSGRNSKRPSTRRQADFAMALGTFYCRHLQAPIMAHDRTRRRGLCDRLRPARRADAEAADPAAAVTCITAYSILQCRRDRNRAIAVAPVCSAIRRTFFLVALARIDRALTSANSTDDDDATASGQAKSIGGAAVALRLSSCVRQAARLLRFPVRRAPHECA